MFALIAFFFLHSPEATVGTGIGISDSRHRIGGITYLLFGDVTTGQPTLRLSWPRQRELQKRPPNVQLLSLSKKKLWI